MDAPEAVNPIANALLAVTSQGVALTSTARAGKAAKRLRSALTLRDMNQLTTPELGEQLVYATGKALVVVGENQNLPPDVPVWIPVLMQRFDQMQADTNERFDAMQADTNERFDAMQANINQRFDALDARLEAITTRQINAVALDSFDRIRPLRNAAGELPPNFPQNASVLFGATNARTRSLLLFYGLPVNPANTRNQRLRKFLGCPH